MPVKKKKGKKLGGVKAEEDVTPMDTWFVAVFSEDLEKMRQMLEDKVVSVDDRVDKAISPGIKGNCPRGIAKKDRDLVKFYEGDTALHFACRFLKREAITFLVKNFATKDGDQWRNARGEDPREVAQTMDGFIDAGKKDDFDPIEPLLDPHDNVHVEMWTGETFTVPVRVVRASNLASTGVIDIFADTIESVMHKIFIKKALPPSSQRLFFEQIELSLQDDMTHELGALGIKDQDWLALLQPPGTVYIDYNGYEETPPSDSLYFNKGAGAGSLYSLLPPPLVYVERHQTEMTVELFRQQVRSTILESTTVGMMRDTQSELEGIPIQYLIPHYYEETKIPLALDPDSTPEVFDVAESKFCFEDYGIPDGAVFYMRPPSPKEARIERKVEIEPEVTEVVVKEKPDFRRRKELIGAAGAALVKVEKTKSLDRLVHPPPSEVDIWRGVEVVAYGEGSMRLWEETIEKDPRDSYAHRRLGRAYEANGQRAQAMGHYRAAIAIDPEYNYAKRDLGVALAAEGCRSEALQLLQEVLQSDPNYCQCYCDMGDILAAESDWDGAMWHYDSALSRNIEYSTTSSGPILVASYRVAAFRGIGIVLCAQRHQAKGIAKLREALALCPEDKLTQYHLALATGRDKELVQENKWTRQDKYHSELGMRAANLLQAGVATRPLDMAHLYREAHKKNPDDQLPLLRLGASLFCAQDSAHGLKGDLL